MDKEAASSCGPKRRWKRTEGRILVAFGLLFLLVGLILLTREIAFQREAISGSGSVIELRVTESVDGPITTPIVEFRTPDGIAFRCEGTATSPAPRLGEAVPIIYLPDDPQHARINTFVQRWLFPTCFTPVGLLLVLAGTYLGRRVTTR